MSWNKTNLVLWQKPLGAQRKLKVFGNTREAHILHLMVQMSALRSLALNGSPVVCLAVNRNSHLLWCLHHLLTTPLFCFNSSLLSNHRYWHKVTSSNSFSHNSLLWYPPHPLLVALSRLVLELLGSRSECLYCQKYGHHIAECRKRLARATASCFQSQPQLSQTSVATTAHSVIHNAILLLYPVQVLPVQVLPVNHHIAPIILSTLLTARSLVTRILILHFQLFLLATSQVTELKFFLCH